MKKCQIALGVFAMASVFTAGCSSLSIVNDPDTFTPRHEEWYAAVHANYPGWRPDPLVQVQSAPLRPVITYGTAKKAKPTEQDEPVIGETPVALPQEVIKPLPPIDEQPKLVPIETVAKPIARPVDDPALVPSSTYVVKNGDTLSGISLSTYGTTRHWQKILEANPSIKDAKRLRYGMKITLPALPGRRTATVAPAAAPVPVPAPVETDGAELPPVPAEPVDAVPEVAAPAKI